MSGDYLRFNGKNAPYSSALVYLGIARMAHWFDLTFLDERVSSSDGCPERHRFFTDKDNGTISTWETYIHGGGRCGIGNHKPNVVTMARIEENKGTAIQKLSHSILLYSANGDIPRDTLYEEIVYSHISETGEEPVAYQNRESVERAGHCLRSETDLHRSFGHFQEVAVGNISLTAMHAKLFGASK